MPLTTKSEEFSQTATIVARHPSGDRDEYGEDVPTTVEVEVECEIQQQRRFEASDEELGHESWLGIFAAGTNLEGADALTVAGIGTFELDGPPWHVWDPFERVEHHVEATLVLTEGEGRPS